MSSTMRKWIGETVTRELKLALDWTKHELSVGNCTHSVAIGAITPAIKQEEEATKREAPLGRDYQNDGSNFIINLSCLSIAMPLQIIKFLDYNKQPLEAEVSDSECTILARFSKEATTKFEKENHNKRFTDGTQGGIFHIRGAQLITTRYGNSQSKVQLMIEDFRFRGASGSNTFGKPQYLHQSKWKEQVRNLVKDLFVVLEEQARATLEQTLGSEPLLKTESNEEVEVRPVSTFISEGDLMLNSQVPFLTQPFISEPGPSSRVEERGKRSEKLLAIYKQGNAAPDSISQRGKSPRTKSKERTVLQRETEQSRRSTSPYRIRLGSSRPTHPGLRSEAANKGQTHAVEQVATELNGKCQSSSIKALSDINSIFHTGNFKLVQTLMNCGSIPKNQEDILRRQSSWAHPAPGFRFPNANIPIDLLAEFNKLVETRKSKQQIRSEQQSDPSADKEAKVADFTISLPGSPSRQTSPSNSSISIDKPLPWSSSPPEQPSPMRLPPDSSALSPQSRQQSPTKGIYYESETSLVAKNMDSQQPLTGSISRMLPEASSDAELPPASFSFSQASTRQKKSMPDRGLKYGKGVFAKTAIRSSIPSLPQSKAPQNIPITSSPTSSGSTSPSPASLTVIDFNRLNEQLKSSPHQGTPISEAASDTISIQNGSSNVLPESNILASSLEAPAIVSEVGDGSAKRKHQDCGMPNSAAQYRKKQRMERNPAPIAASDLDQLVKPVEFKNTSSSSEGAKPVNNSPSEAIVQSTVKCTRLRIGNLPYATTEGDLEEFFKDYQVKVISMHVDPHINPLTIRTIVYAFLYASTPAEAERAVSELNGKTIFDCEVVVQLADAPRNDTVVPHIEKDKAAQFYEAPGNEVVIQGIANSKGLFIKNLPFTATEGEVKDFLKDYLVETVSLPVDVRTNRPKGYAFVNTSTPSEAARAVAGLQGKSFPNRNNLVPFARESKDVIMEDPALTARKNRSEALAAIKNGTFAPSEAGLSTNARVAHVGHHISHGSPAVAVVSVPQTLEERNETHGLQIPLTTIPSAIQEDTNGTRGLKIASTPTPLPNLPVNNGADANDKSLTSQDPPSTTESLGTMQEHPKMSPKQNSSQVHAKDSVQVERTPPQGYATNVSFQKAESGRFFENDISKTTEKPLKSDQASSPPIKSYEMAALGAFPLSQGKGFEGLLWRFREAYPDYGGDLKHFKAMCTRAQAAQHQFLWDDFVVRHKLDYVTYTIKCNEEGSDPTSYEKFYLDQIEDPKYSQRVLSKGTLDAASSSETRFVDTIPITLSVGVSSFSHHKTNSHSSTNAPTPTSLQKGPPTSLHKGPPSVDDQREDKRNASTGANGDNYQARDITSSAIKKGRSELDAVELPTRPSPRSRTLPWSTQPHNTSDTGGRKFTAEANPNQIPVSFGSTDRVRRQSPRREWDSYSPSTAPTGPRMQANRLARFSAPMPPYRNSGATRAFSDQSRHQTSKPNPSNDQRQVPKLEPQTHASKVSKITILAGGEDSMIASISPPSHRRTASNPTSVAEAARPSTTTSMEDVIKSIEQAPSQQNEWWKDEATPFKEYARQYADLKLFQTARLSPLTRLRSHIDVFAWKLP